jgi:hypothetical protein
MPAVVFGIEHFLYIGITTFLSVFGLLLAKKYAKEGLALKRIYADVSANNLPMRAVMKKCGFLNTKTFKADMPDGSDRMVFFALL